MAYNKVLIKKYVPKREERVAGGTITPGHLIQLNSSDQFVVHSTAGGEITPLIVAECDLEQGGGLSDNYATTGNYRRVQGEVLDPGDQFYGILKNGENVVIGDKGESAGDGTLQKFVADSGAVTEKSNQIACIFLEAVDMSGSSGEDPSGRVLCMAV